MAETQDEIAIGADVDVKAIMAAVRAEVERKKREGLYPPEVLEEVDALGARDDVDQLARALLGLRHGVRFDTSVPTASRLPVVSPLAASFKRAVRTSIHWYVSAIVQQVEQFGANVVHVLNLVSERLRGLEDRIDSEQESLETSIRALELQITDVRTTLHAAIESARAESGAETFRASKRLDELEKEVSAGRARDRLALLERAVRSLEKRVASPMRSASEATSDDRSAEADSAIDYLDFEGHFRGSEEEIASRQAAYLEYFRNVPAGPVVDLGCGRGEFLELLREAGIRSYGVDRHAGMVAVCGEKGLDVRLGDVIDHLSEVPAGSLGGVFAAQVIEHLPVQQVPRFFELAADCLAPGGRLVVETINPQSLVVFAEAFYIDLGHLRPLHPLTLRFLAEKAGFTDVDIRYSSPPSDDQRPMHLSSTGTSDVDELVEALNENFRRIDGLLFGPQDYAIVASR